MLMNNKNITKDFILLDLYKDDLTFYFSLSTTYLSAISASIIINLYLNKKIKLKDNKIVIVDEECYRSYNQHMMNYIKDNNYTNLKELAHDLFINNDFSLELYEKVIEELKNDDIIEITQTKKFLLTKNVIKLKNQELVRASYKKLYSTLFNEDDSQEFVALALIIDTFFSVDDYFDKEDHLRINEALIRLRSSDIYDDIVVFKDVIEEFYQLIAQRSTNYFGI